MNINKPTNREKEKAIENILSQGLSKHDSIWDFFCKMYSSLGLKFIFFDISQAIIMAIAITIGFSLLYALSSEQYMYSKLFVLSPLFFITVIFFTEFIERNDRLYDLKMTLKYNIQQIIIFRVLCYSLISIVICVLISGSVLASYNFLRAVSISLSALFICALLTIYVMRRFKGHWIPLTSFAVWISIVFIPVLIFGERWELLLSQIPIGITIAVGVIGFVLYLIELKKLINMNKRGGLHYVGS